MMIRINSEYLEFDGEVVLDRKVKLFEVIESIEGDISFEFEIQPTHTNLRLLEFPFPDTITKLTYSGVPADLLTDAGQLVSRGLIKVERITRNIMCSFFGGNSNWFAMIGGNMTDLDLSGYDQDQDQTTIVNSWFDTEGIVWPLIDTGALSTRSYQSTKVEDYVPCFYVKTLMKELFQGVSIKLAGELLDDWRYNNLIVAANGRSKEEIEARGTYVNKTSTQAVDPTYEVIEFDDDSNYPYYDGSQNNFDITTDRYTADVKMTLRVTVTITLDNNGVFLSKIFTNGIEPPGSEGASTASTILTYTRTLSLEAGDYVEVRSAYVLIGMNIISATVKFEPMYLYRAFGNSAIPKWTKQQFVAQVLALFNVIPSFDPYTKTLTLNLFDKIKTKEPVDISRHIESVEVDYSEFISDYGKQNNFMYQETDIDNLNEYNISTFLKYGVGSIPVSNAFLEPSVDVLESDFASPISYVNGAFDMSLERIQFVETSEGDATDFGSVSDASGVARFNISDDIFLQNDLVRITDSTVPGYNGEWVVSTVGAGYIQLRGLDYVSNGTGTITKLNYEFSTEDNVYLFLNIPNYDIVNASSNTGIYLNQSFQTDASIAYFNLLNTGKLINEQYKQGLSFGAIEDPLFYQQTMIQSYWSTFGRILNDPVKLRVIAHLPWVIHNKLDFLRPVVIKTLETTNLYYCNLERGYESSDRPVEIELIKLP